ncbi:MAG TPA: ATP-binding protein [Chloroflexota bacterium]|nr:ATP-binding protein [Chloroflexota bacterium]
MSPVPGTPAPPAPSGPLRAWRLPSLSLRDKLLLSHLGLVLLAMALAGLYVLNQMERFYLEQLHSDLVVESTLLTEPAADALVGNDFQPLRDMLAAVDRESAVRVRVFDASGRLVAATESDEERIGEPPSPPGLAAALRGERTISVANNGTGPEVLYIVAPVIHDGQVRGAVRLAYTLADVNAEVDSLRRALLIGLAGVGALTVVVAGLLAASLAAPARRLASAAAQLAAGNLAIRCDVRGSDEIAAAAHAFDDMAARLQALEGARQELMGAVAHDLHSSTMALGMAVEALERGAADDPLLRAELLRGIGGHTHRLTRLADDLLQTAQLETGGLRLDQEPLAPVALLRQAAAEFAADAAARRVLLVVEAPDPLALVEGDAARLGQALANLVENALRHAPPGSTVHLQAEARSGEVVLAVADEGPGLGQTAVALNSAEPPGAASAPPGPGQRRGRLGLGLAIVRGIVEAHGGRLEITSAPGAGARFALVLPTLPSGDVEWLPSAADRTTAFSES